jgi:hypothetical protein
MAVTRAPPRSSTAAWRWSLVEREGRRFTTPDGTPNLPLMFGAVATRPA